MAGSSSTNLTPNANDIWSLFSEISQKLPRQAPLTHNEEISQAPLSIGQQVDEAGKPDENSIIDIFGTLLAGPRAGPATVIGGGVEAIKQLYQHATGSPKAPQTTLEAAERIGEKGLEYGVGTKVGEYVGKGVSAGVKKLTQKPMVPAAAEAQKFAAEGMGGMAPQNPLALTPAQMTDDHIYGVLENVGKGSIFGGGPLHKFELANEEVTKRTIEKYADNLGRALDKEQLGDLFVRINRGDLRVAQAPAKAIYAAIEREAAPKEVMRTVMKPHPSLVGANGKPIMVAEQVKDLEGGAWADMRGLKEWAKPIADRADETANLGTDITGGALAKRIMAMDDFVTYSAAKDLRQVARSLGAEFKVNNKTAPAIGVARHAEGMLTKSVDEALGRFNPALQAQEREANKIYRQASSQYDNTFVRHLIKVATEKEGGLPEQIYGMIVKPQGPSVIRRAKAAINAETDGKELWQSFGAKTLQTVLGDATDKTTQRIDFQKLNNLLFSKTELGEKGGLGMKVMRELYTPEQLKWIKDAVNLGIQQQKGNPTDVGRMLIQMKTGGAVAAVAAATVGTFGMGYAYGPEGGLATGAGILLGPELIARVMTNPATAKWFVKGMTTPKDAPQAKYVAKQIAEEFGLFPGTGVLTPTGRLLSQKMAAETRARMEEQPEQGVVLP